MNREIKFRAWSFDPVLEESQMLSHEDLDRLDREGLEHLFDIINGKDKYIIPMQYTGLKDKNGVDIYEGDIIKTDTYKLMVVGWSVRFASFTLNREGWAFSHWFGETIEPEDCTVIGNIHQNPELIR